MPVGPRVKWLSLLTLSGTLVGPYVGPGIALTWNDAAPRSNEAPYKSSKKAPFSSWKQRQIIRVFTAVAYPAQPGPRRDAPGAVGPLGRNWCGTTRSGPPRCPGGGRCGAARHLVCLERVRLLPLHPDLFARFVLPESEWTDLRSAEPSSTLAARLLLQFLIAAGFSGVAAAAARFGRDLLDDASGHLEEFGVPCWLSLRSVSNAS